MTVCYKKVVQLTPYKMTGVPPLRAILFFMIFHNTGGGSPHALHKIHSHMRVTTYNNPLAGLPSSTAVGNLGLIEYDLLCLLTKQLNFTYNIVVPRDVRQLGTRQPNGSWTGTLGLLANQEADVSISFGIRNWLRQTSFDLTSAILTDNMAIMVPFPTIGLNSAALVDIYTPFTWFVFLLSTAATVIYLWLLSKAIPDDRVQFGNLAMFMTSVIIGQQGGWLKSRSVRFQIVLGLWLLGLLVVTYGYTGLLISRMSAPSINYLVRSLEDVASASDIVPYTVRDSATHAEFKESKLSSFRMVNEKFLANPNVSLLPSFDDVVEVIMSDNRQSVFIFSDIVIENEIEKDYRKTGQCRAYMLPEKALVRRNGLFLQKNSPWTHSFDDQILKLRQHGFGKHLEVKYKKFTTGKCSLNEQQVRKREFNGPIKFYHIKGAFYLLAFGVFISFVVFVVENIYFRYSRKKSMS